MRRALRIEYLSHSLLPSCEANSVHVMKMCESLSGSAEVVLSCRLARTDVADLHAHYGVREVFAVRGARIPRVPVLGRLLHSLLTLARLLGSPRPGLLYARDQYLLGLIAILGAPRCPMVLEVHRPPRRWIEGFLQRRIFASRRFARLVVISDALREEYAARFGAELAAKIVVARDAAEPDARRGRRADLEPDARHGRNADLGAGFHVGYVGSLQPGKGVDLLLEVAARLPACTFHVVGGSEREVDEWRRRASLPNAVFHGHRPPEEVPDYLARFDVVLAPYRERVRVGRSGVDVGRWMSPLKIFEYMAAGKPIVASDLPVLREFLDNGRDVLLAPPDDVASWVERIEELRDDPRARRRLGAAARARLLRAHTWRERARAVLEGLETGAAA